MAKRKTAYKRGKRKGKGTFKKRLILFLLLILVGFLGYSYITSNIVHVKYVDAYIKGLPVFLNGTKILFASDLKMTGQADAKKTADLLKNLNQMNPDLILLGGDYTGMSFTDMFKVQTDEGKSSMNERLKQARMTFFSEIASLSPTGGIFAVSGDGDRDVPDLYSDCKLGGVTLIENGIETAIIRNTPLTIVGYADYLTGGSSSFKFRGPTSSDPVIILSHNPDVYPLASSVTDEYGYPIADLILSGHTLGGQINLFGKSIMSVFGGYTGPYMKGYYNETGPYMLVSEGVGCDRLPFRLGSEAHIYMITLKRK